MPLAYTLLGGFTFLEYLLSEVRLFCMSQTFQKGGVEFSRASGGVSSCVELIINRK